MSRRLRHPGYLLYRHPAWARVYLRTFVDTYSKVAFAKLYNRKASLPPAALLNDRVVPFFDSYGIPLSRVLTDRGTEYCGNPEHREYELYLAVENVDRTRTRAKLPQTNGIVVRLHKTMLNEFYRMVFHKKGYDSIGALQVDLDAWLDQYNNQRGTSRTMALRQNTYARVPQLA